MQTTLANGMVPEAIAIINADGTIATVSGGGGGGGGAVTVADSADVTEGGVADAAASAGGTGTISAKLRRISTQLPAAVGTAAMAASMPVTLATDDTLTGAKTETAPASDTASSGLNGRLQRIAQRITSLIAQVPAALGSTTSAASLSVTSASDDAVAVATGAIADAAVTAGATGSLSAKLRSISRDLVANIVLAAGENMLGKTVGIVTNPSANFTRPADTTAYTVGDLVANSTTAGSVTALTYSTAIRTAAGNASLRKCRLSKTTTSVANAIFRAHVFSATPLAPTNGDNGVFIPVGAATYLGAFDIFSMVQCTDGSSGNGAPLVGGDINVALGSGQIIYALLEARAAYTPGNAEVFTLALEIFQN